MFSFLAKIQKKPDHQKRKIVFALSSTITGIIFIIWLSVIRLEFTTENVAEENSVSPLDALKANALDGFSNISEGIKEITSEIKNAKNELENGTTTIADPETATTTELNNQ